MIEITRAQYEQMVGLARQGITTADGQRELDRFFQTIEQTNNLSRYFLWVRWQEVGQVAPINEPFPAGWPPTQEIKIERLDSPITKELVESVVADRSVNPASILVSEDPGGELGWATIDQYFA